MKKLKFVTIVALIIACIFAVSCKEEKTNFQKLQDHVSTLQEGLYTASDDNFDIKLSISTQEDIFVADGKVDNLSTVTTLIATPKDTASLSKSFTYTLEGSTDSCQGSLTKNKLSINLVSKIEDAQKIGTPTTLTLKEGENTYVYQLTDMCKDIISGTDALKLAYEHFQSDIDTALDNDSFDRECYVKLITQKSTNQGQYLWYVSFIKDKSDYWSVVIDPATSQILGSRQYSKANS